MEGNMHAVIYARVSTEEQGDNFSIPAQLAACREYAERNGLQVVAECIDTMSGARLDRPGLQQVRDLVSQQLVQAVIVYHQDRLSRNLAHFLYLRDEFQNARIALHFTTLGQARDTPEDKLIQNMIGSFAEHERLRIIERTKQGRRARLLSGKPLGLGNHPAYGYHWHGTKHDRHLHINEAEAAIVRRIFAWALEGVPTQRIAKLLTDMGVTPRGRAGRPPRPEWDHTTVAGMLRNPVYKGQYYSAAHNLFVPVPAIVDAETWEAVQEQLTRNQAMAKRNAKRVYSLRGRIRCGICGNRMSGNGAGTRASGKTYHYYMCHAAKGALIASCNHGTSYRAERLEALVWQWVIETVLDETRLVRAIEAARANEAGQREALEHERAAYARQIAEAGTRTARLIELYTAGVCTLDEVAATKKQYELQRQSAQRELDRIDAQLAALNSHHANRDALLAMARALKAALQIEATPEEQMKVYEALDVQVVVRENNIDVRAVLTGDAGTFLIAGEPISSTR